MCEDSHAIHPWQFTVLWQCGKWNHKARKSRDLTTGDMFTAVLRWRLKKMEGKHADLVIETSESLFGVLPGWYSGVQPNSCTEMRTGRRHFLAQERHLRSPQNQLRKIRPSPQSEYHQLQLFFITHVESSAL